MICSDHCWDDGVPTFRVTEGITKQRLVDITMWKFKAKLCIMNIMIKIKRKTYMEMFLPDTMDIGLISVVHKDNDMNKKISSF